MSITLSHIHTHNTYTHTHTTQHTHNTHTQHTHTHTTHIHTQHTHTTDRQTDTYTHTTHTHNTHIHTHTHTTHTHTYTHMYISTQTCMHALRTSLSMQGAGGPEIGQNVFGVVVCITAILSNLTPQRIRKTPEPLLIDLALVLIIFKLLNHLIMTM